MKKRVIAILILSLTVLFFTSCEQEYLSVPSWAWGKYTSDTGKKISIGHDYVTVGSYNYLSFKDDFSQSEEVKEDGSLSYSVLTLWKGRIYRFVSVHKNERYLSVYIDNFKGSEEHYMCYFDEQ